MGKSSRDKGYRAERDLVKLLNQLGFNSHRVPLSGAQWPYVGDVIANLHGFDYNVEVKNREDNPSRLWDWLENSDILALKRNRHGWLVVMHLTSFLNLLDDIQNGNRFP